MSVPSLASTSGQQFRSPTLWPRRSRGITLRAPLAQVLAPLGLSLIPPALRQTLCAIRRLAPGEHLCDAGARRYESFVVCRGLAVRRDADGAVRMAVGIAGPREALALYGPRMTRHAETIVAMTALEVAVIETRVLCAGEANDSLLGRIVAGPQSAACMRHWVRFARIRSLAPGERLRAGLNALAEMLGQDRNRLRNMALNCDGLAQWMDMPPPATLAELAALERGGALRVNAGVVHAIDADTVWGLNRFGAHFIPGTLALRGSAADMSPGHG